MTSHSKTGHIIPFCQELKFIPNVGIYCLIQGYLFGYQAQTQKVWVQIGEQWALASERQLMEHPLLQQTLADRYKKNQDNYKRPSFPSARQRHARRVASYRAGAV